MANLNETVTSAIEVLDRPGPQLATTGGMMLLGYTAQDWVWILTIIYLLLMIAWYIRKHLRGFDRDG